MVFRQRIFSVLFFLITLLLVFYLGFLYGNKEIVNITSNNLRIVNNNGQTINSITEIKQRPIFGSKDSQKIETFGNMYYLINNQKQTEIVIFLENIPSSFKQSVGNKEVIIPSVLSVEIAKRIVDTDNRENYEYKNISNTNIKAAININETNENGLKKGKFSGIIEEDVTNLDLKIERLIIRSLDETVSNIFIDKDPNLPLKIRGNNELNVQGKPAPFFWAIF